MRFVRPATSYKEQNLMLSQQGSSLYFTTIEVIHPKQELLVWYGAAYSRSRACKPFPDDPFGMSMTVYLYINSTRRVIIAVYYKMFISASVPFEIIDRIDDLSTFFSPDKNTMKETFGNVSIHGRLQVLCWRLLTRCNLFWLTQK